MEGRGRESLARTRILRGPARAAAGTTGFATPRPGRALSAAQTQPDNGQWC